MLILFAGLKSISKCSKLSSLKIGICLNISDKGLSHIGMKCSKLADLDLYRYLVAILEFFSLILILSGRSAYVLLLFAWF
jgi:hypothetical protein